MKASGTVDAIGKIVTWILVVLLVLGIAGGAAYLAMKESGVSFYAETAGEKIFGGTERETGTFSTGQTYDFSVRALEGGDINYSVKVTANPENNFDFVLDGKTYRFSGEDEERNDYSEVFALTRRDGRIFPDDSGRLFRGKSREGEVRGGRADRERTFGRACLFFGYDRGRGEPSADLLPLFARTSRRGIGLRKHSVLKEAVMQRQLCRIAAVLMSAVSVGGAGRVRPRRSGGGNKLRTDGRLGRFKRRRDRREAVRHQRLSL